MKKLILILAIATLTGCTHAEAETQYADQYWSAFIPQTPSGGTSAGVDSYVTLKGNTVNAFITPPTGGYILKEVIGSTSNCPISLNGVRLPGQSSSTNYRLGSGLVLAPGDTLYIECVNSAGPSFILTGLVY